MRIPGLTTNLPMYSLAISNFYFAQRITNSPCFQLCSEHSYILAELKHTQLGNDRYSSINTYLSLKAILDVCTKLLRIIKSKAEPVVQ